MKQRTFDVKVISEHGYYPALYGIGLSYGITGDMGREEVVGDRLYKLEYVSQRLSGKPIGSGEDKFLRMLVVYMSIDAPLYWWKQFDTYKVGTVAQSESTMHTLHKNKKFCKEMFEDGNIADESLDYLNGILNDGDIHLLYGVLPSNWMQERLVMCNYAVLKAIFKQRCHHKLPDWQKFTSMTYHQLADKYFFDSVIEGENLHEVPAD